MRHLLVLFLLFHLILASPNAFSTQNLEANVTRFLHLPVDENLSFAPAGTGDGSSSATAAAAANIVGQIKFVAYNVIAYIIVGLGIVGNLLNLLVLTRPNLKGVMYVYLLGLAVSNLCVLVTAVPALFDISEGLRGGDYTTAFYQAHLELPLINTFMASSVYIIICMTVNRYISIYRPTHFQRIHTHKNAKLSILASFLGGIILHIPLCFQNTVVCMQSGGMGDNDLGAMDTLYNNGTSLLPDNYTDEDYIISNSLIDSYTYSVTNTTPEQHFNWSLCDWKSQENEQNMESFIFRAYLVASEILLRFGPIITLAILNTLILFKFHKIAKKRQRLKGYSSAAAGVNGGPGGGVASGRSPPAPSSPYPSSNLQSVGTHLSRVSVSHHDVGGGGGHLEKLQPQAVSLPSTSSAVGSSLVVVTVGSGGAGGGGVVGVGAVVENGAKSSAPTSLLQRQRTTRASTRRRSLQSPEERMLVVVLISIVLLFVLCTTPAAVLSILYSVKLNRHLGFQVFRAVANNLELLNFALNFYIYCLCSAEIRRAFTSLFLQITAWVRLRLGYTDPHQLETAKI